MNRKKHKHFDEFSDLLPQILHSNRYLNLFRFPILKLYEHQLAVRFAPNHLIVVQYITFSFFHSFSYLINILYFKTGSRTSPTHYFYFFDIITLDMSNWSDEMTLKETIANRILQLCEERNLTPYSLAMLCGIEKTTIYSILGEKSKNPEISTIKKICDGLEITLGEFFNTPEFDSLEPEIR